jgi:hypothetical protein
MVRPVWVVVLGGLVVGCVPDEEATVGVCRVKLNNCEAKPAAVYLDLDGAYRASQYPGEPLPIDDVCVSDEVLVGASHVIEVINGEGIQSGLDFVFGASEDDLVEDGWVLEETFSLAFGALSAGGGC